jgi:dsRNA-specific ribonuclease
MDILPDFIERFQEMMDDPRLQIMKTINEAKEDDNDFELILCLGIFFEAVLIAAVETETGDDISDEDFYDVIERAAEEELIDDDKKDLLHKLRRSRNEYAHDIEAHHPDYETEIVEDGEVEQAYSYFSNLPVSLASEIDVDRV